MKQIYQIRSDRSAGSISSTRTGYIVPAMNIKVSKYKYMSRDVD